MKRNIIAFFLLAMSLQMMGCVNARIVMLSQTNYPPITEEEVKIYENEADLPAQFEKVAIITVSNASSFDRRKWIRVRVKCAKIGANGVYTRMENRASSGARVAAAIFGTIATDKSEFVAIRTTENESRPKTSYPTISTIAPKADVVPKVELDRKNNISVGTVVLFEHESAIYKGVVEVVSDDGIYARIKYKNKQGKESIKLLEIDKLQKYIEKR